jgi:hypothetical protein
MQFQVKTGRRQAIGLNARNPRSTLSNSTRIEKKPLPYNGLQSICIAQISLQNTTQQSIALT